MQAVKKILIAGSSGFIGKNLIPYLENKSYLVKKLSLRDLNWKKSLEEDGDVVINLVGKAHDHEGKATESDYFNVNVECTKELFKEFLNSNYSTFIHVSSISAIEEFESKTALTEKSLPNPHSFYGKSKLVAENWLLSQKIPSNKQVIILRPPMVHGKGDKGNLGLLYKFISKGIPYPLGAFDNIRSFIYIENFSFYIQQIIENPHYLDSNLYNISDDDPLATKEIINIISEITHKKVKRIHFPKTLIKVIAKLGDVISLPLNTKRLLKLTGNLVVSNVEINRQLRIKNLPYNSKDGLIETIKSFK